MDDWKTDRMKKMILDLLQYKHVGKGSAITGKALTKYLNLSSFPEIDQRGVRIAIRELRREYQPICSAAGLGYWWPASIEEAEECRAVEFDSKAKDMLVTGKAMFEGAVRLFGGQRSLTL